MTDVVHHYAIEHIANAEPQFAQSYDVKRFADRAARDAWVSQGVHRFACSAARAAEIVAAKLVLVGRDALIKDMDTKEIA